MILVEGTQPSQLGDSAPPEGTANTKTCSRTVIPETQDRETAAAEALAVVSAVLPPDQLAVGTALAASCCSGNSFLTPGQTSPSQKTKQTKLQMKKMKGN